MEKRSSVAVSYEWQYKKVALIDIFTNSNPQTFKGYPLKLATLPNSMQATNNK